MTSTSDMNIILGQGTAIKEIHNAKKQNLEVNQHFVAQDTADRKKDDKSKVKKFDQKDSVEIKSDRDKENHKKRKKKKGDSDIENSKEDLNLSEGNIINITV